MGHHSPVDANAANAANVSNASNEPTTNYPKQAILSELSSIIKINHSGTDLTLAFKTVGTSRDGHIANDVASNIFNRNIENYSIALASIDLIFKRKIPSFKLLSKYGNFDDALGKIDSYVKREGAIKFYKKLGCWLDDEEFMLVDSLAVEIKQKILNRRWADLFDISEVEYYEVISSHSPLFIRKNKETQRNIVKGINEKLLNAAATVRLKRLYDSLVVQSPQEIARQERSRQLDEEYERLKRNEEEKERRRGERTATANSKKSAEPQPPPSSSAAESRVEEPQPTEQVHPDADDEAQQAPSGDGSSAADMPVEALNTGDTADHFATTTDRAEQAATGDDSSGADMPEETPNTADPTDPKQTATYEAEQAPTGDDSSAADMPDEAPNARYPADPIPTTTDKPEEAPTGDDSSAADMKVEAPHSAEAEPATKDPEPYDHEAEFASRRASAAKFISDQDLVKKSKKDVMQSDKDRLANELSSHYYYIMDTRKNPEKLAKLAEVARSTGEKINLSNFNGDIATGNRELLRWIFPKVTSKKQSLNARINEWGAVFALAEESQWDKEHLCNELKSSGLKKLLKKLPDEVEPSLTYNKETGYWEIKDLPSDASLMINGTIVDTINDVAIDEFLYY